jgi:hypothetical protein
MKVNVKYPITCYSYRRHHPCRKSCECRMNCGERVNMHYRAPIVHGNGGMICYSSKSDFNLDYLIEEEVERRDRMTEAACRTVSTASNESSASIILTLFSLLVVRGVCGTESILVSLLLQRK